MESAYAVHLTEDTHGQFARLSQFFDLEYSVGRGNAPRLPGIEIIHSTPLSKVGSLERPLVFPRAILDRCRAGWPATRPIRFFFAGLISEQREQALRVWARTSAIDISVPRPASAFSTWIRRRVLRARPRAVAKAESGDAVLWSSARGREYPMKAWDDDYCRAMTRAQFVLCPSGDFVWTYRFFEAAMCGAIPVIESECPAYAGFQFFTMRQQGMQLRWTEAMAEHNLGLCLERLTIPRQHLDEEIARLLRG
jgi:hypothetical protein